MEFTKYLHFQSSIALLSETEQSLNGAYSELTLISYYADMSLLRVKNVHYSVV